MVVERPKGEVKKMLLWSIGGAAVGVLAGIGVGIWLNRPSNELFAFGFGGALYGGILTIGLLGDIPSNSTPTSVNT